MNQGEPTDAERARAEHLVARFNASPYYQLIGLHAEAPRPGESLVTMRYDDKLTQAYGAVHGGALLTLADSAIGIAVATTTKEHEATATVDITMQFQRPLGPHDAIAEGRVTRRGGKLAFGECVITAADGRVVARAHGVWFIGPAERIDKNRDG